MSTPAAAPSPRPFLLACPDLSSERAGNTDTPGCGTSIPACRASA